MLGIAPIVICIHIMTLCAEHLFLILQSSIQAEGFRSLREGEEVEYDVEAGPDGRTKAINVTGPGGAAPQVCPEPLSCSSCAHSTVWPGCSTNAANALLLPDPADQAPACLHTTSAGLDANKQLHPASASTRPAFCCTASVALQAATGQALLLLSCPWISAVLLLCLCWLLLVSCLLLQPTGRPTPQLVPQQLSDRRRLSSRRSRQLQRQWPRQGATHGHGIWLWLWGRLRLLWRLWGLCSLRLPTPWHGVPHGRPWHAGRRQVPCRARAWRQVCRLQGRARHGRLHAARAASRKQWPAGEKGREVAAGCRTPCSSVQNRGL